MKIFTVKRISGLITLSALMFCLSGCKVEIIDKTETGAEINQTESGALSNQIAQGVGDYPQADGQQNEEAEGKENTQNEISPEQYETSASDRLPLNIQPVQKVRLDLQPFDGGFFSMNLPKGWKMEPVGEYENFGFCAYDPENPARQIFFYGNMKYFLKSDAGKEAWATYLKFGGYSDAQVYADALVLSPATTEQFFYTFNDYTSYAAKYGVVHNFVTLNDLEIVESAPRNSPIAANCVDDSIVRALFTNNDIPCEGLFAAGVADAMTSYMYDVDAGYYVVYFITGISAPADEFYLLQDTLAQSLSSFQYAQSYINQGVQRINEGTKLALEIGKMLSQAADANNKAWHDRQRPIDAISQKRSDARLGYDRLYDTDTGEIYRAELGFYDNYDINRNEYANPYLKPVPDNDYDLFEREISGYIFK